MIDTFAIRCSVLHLAFGGVLTEQIETDEKVSTLLARVNPTKSIVQTENVPYDIPASWAWVKLSDLYMINPKVEANDNMDSAFVPMEKISAGFDKSFSYEIQNWAQASKNHTRFSDGDVAFAKITPCFENRKSFIACGLPNGIGGGTTELIILRQSEMLPEYTYYLILDQRFILTGTSSYKGTVGQQRVQSDVVKNYLVPVPPYEEQKRIVEKIQQSFFILDTIDALQTQYHDNLAILKSKLIDAGIQGKLTEQLPEDGTAEELYQQIQQEKQALEKAGKIKKSKPLPPVSDEEKPFDIPDSWKWVRFSNLMTNISTGPFGSMLHKSDYVSKGIPLVNPMNIVNGKILPSEKMMVSEESKLRLSSYILHEGMIVMGRRGEIGRCAIVNKNEEGWLCGTGSFFMEPINRIFVKYIVILLSTIYAKTFLGGQSIGMTMSNLNHTILTKMPVPLPPLSEQKRIVAMLEEMLPLCEMM